MASFEAAGGELFKEDWVKFSEEEPDTGDFYIAVDLAGFEAEGSSGVKNKRLDNTAIAIVKANDKGWWVADIVTDDGMLKKPPRRYLMLLKSMNP